MSELRLDPPRTFLPLVGRLRGRPLSKISTPLGIGISENDPAHPSRLGKASQLGKVQEGPSHGESDKFESGEFESGKREAGISEAGEDSASPLRGESHRYFGCSLHQGSLPFITLNGMYITFSPFLLGMFGIATLSLTLNLFGVSETHGIEPLTEPLPWILPLLAVILILAQLGGHLLSGWIFSTPPESLILSATGVIDPGLIFRERPVIHIPELYETEHGIYLKGVSREEIEETNSQLNKRFKNQIDSDKKLADPAAALTADQEELVQEEIRYITHAPLRAVGSSIGALLFLWCLLHSPLHRVIQLGSPLSELFWWYATFLCVSPFLPPHRLGAGFERQLTAALYPLVFFMGLLFTLPTEAQNSFFSALADPLPLLGFIVCVAIRKFWWYRIEAISRTVQEIPIEKAMIPLGNMTLLSHGESIHSAQQRALARDQSIFPLISGSRLLGYVTRNELMRPAAVEPDEATLSALANDRVMLTDKNVSLEACFSPKTSLPLFIIDDEKVIGLVSSESVRDALLLRLQEKFKPVADDFEW